MHCGCTRILVYFDMKQIQAGQIWLTRGSCHGIFAVSWRLLIKCLLRSDWLNLSVRSRPESVDLCDPKGCILEDDHRFASDQVRSMQRLRWLMYYDVLVVCQAIKVRFDKHIRASIQLEREMKPEWRSCTASAYPWEHREQWSLRQGVEDSSRPSKISQL